MASEQLLGNFPRLPMSCVQRDALDFCSVLLRKLLLLPRASTSTRQTERLKSPRHKSVWDRGGLEASW